MRRIGRQALRRRRWQRALESGKYDQTRNVIRRDMDGGGRSYCCLGVAVEIAGPRYMFRPSGVTRSRSTYYAVDRLHRYSETSNLPDALRDALGYNQDDITAFVQMNDTHGFSFPEIATVIEESERTGKSVHSIFNALRHNETYFLSL